MSPKTRALFYVLLLVPLDVVVGVSVTLATAIGLLIRALGKKSGSPPPISRYPSATIQILNWDGKHLLEESVPAALEAVKKTEGDHEVVVVDNGSTDGSVDFIRLQYPEVRIVTLRRNHRFTGGNNRGLETSEKDVVVFLNNDMVVDCNFLDPLLSGFRDPSVFAMTSQVFFRDKTRRREETGKTRGSYEDGFIRLWHDDIEETPGPVGPIPVFWGGGGSCAFDRKKYRAIGGLDTLFDPFYVEDTDISYQAWKRGWKCLLAPESRVVHRHRATTQVKFGASFVDNTIRRNQYLFIWKNLTEWPMIIEHITSLPRTKGRFMVEGDARFEAIAFLRAAIRLPFACWRRIICMQQHMVSDSTVLRISNLDDSHEVLDSLDPLPPA